MAALMVPIVVPIMAMTAIVVVFKLLRLPRRYPAMSRRRIMRVVSWRSLRNQSRGRSKENCAKDKTN